MQTDKMSSRFRDVKFRAALAYQLLAAVLLLSLFFGPFAAVAGNRTYVNPRFGTTITFPDAIFTTQDPPPENGDGARWRSADEAELAVWGQNNVLDYTPDTLADFVSQGIGKVTYRSVSARWMVVSGLEGDTIIYHRAEFGSQGVIHTMELRYPAAQAKHYDTLAGRIADSLIGP